MVFSSLGLHGIEYAESVCILLKNLYHSHVTVFPVKSTYSLHDDPAFSNIHCNFNNFCNNSCYVFLHAVASFQVLPENAVAK